MSGRAVAVREKFKKRPSANSIDGGAVCVAAGGAAANQAGRRAISAAWVIDGDTHCPVFLPRRLTNHLYRARKDEWSLALG
uniref:Uncharacterized protein n=1 Tax=Oryza glumipatula TaxID=40148 RepID=A0A1V1H0D1_9ORYZ|nr:hypothetical protein [Oryza glumipatula]